MGRRDARAGREVRMSDSPSGLPVGAVTALALASLALIVGLYLLFDGTFLGSLIFAAVMLLVAVGAATAEDFNILIRVVVFLGVIFFGMSGIALRAGWVGVGLILLAIVLFSILAEVLARRARTEGGFSFEPPHVDEVALHQVGAPVEAEPDTTLRIIPANQAEDIDSTKSTGSETPPGRSSEARPEVSHEETSIEHESAGETDVEHEFPQGPGPQPEHAPEPERAPDVDVEELIRSVAAVAPEASGDELAREAMSAVGPQASGLEGSIRLAARAFAAGRSASRPVDVVHEKASSTDAHASVGSDVPAASPPRSDPRPNPPAAVVPTRPSDADIAEAPRCYRVGRLWAVRITVDANLRSTSKASIPVTFAQHIEATGETTTFRTLDDLELTVEHQDDGAVLTGVGELVEHLGLVAGDEALLFAPAWRGRPMTVRPILAADLAGLRPAQRATRRMGLTARSTATTLPLAVGLKRTARLADVIEVLHRRGEDDLAELLRDDPVPFHHSTDPVRSPRRSRSDAPAQKRRASGREPSADEPSSVTGRDTEDGAEKQRPSRPHQRRHKGATARSSTKRAETQDAADAERPDKPDVSDIADILGL